MIPERFTRAVDMHLAGNLLSISDFPVILAIIGPPGMGKTYQLRHYLKHRGLRIYSVSAADLESNQAGEPAKHLQSCYVDAATEISFGKPSALLIDDIDTTLGEWEHNTGTVNHQDILAFLMHIADNPEYIEKIGKVDRVPIFFTGNNFNLMYAPLVREGRVTRMDWLPTTEEKIQIVTSMLPEQDARLARRMVEATPEKNVAFFSSLIARMRFKFLSDAAQDLDYSLLLKNSSYRGRLLKQVQQQDWLVAQNIEEYLCNLPKNIEGTVPDPENVPT